MDNKELMPSEPETPLIKEYSSKVTEIRRKELSVGYRDLVVGSPQPFFVNNTVSTTKYTVFTFLPMNLLYQFSKIANLYFLFLTILQIIPEVSISDCIPTILAPLSFIVLLSMIKDAFEDYKRYKSDREENEKQAFVWRQDKFIRIDWKDIRAGDLLKVSKDQFFPADLIVIASSDFKKGQCFIETKNLDGETNLKSKSIPEDLRSLVTNEDQALKLVSSLVNAEGPNQYLSKFKGTIDYAGKKIPLSSNNFLLRGCILRNVEYIFGIVTYTGHQTKIMLNSIKARPKLSSLERVTGQMVIYTFILLIVICLFASFLYCFWEHFNRPILMKYMLEDAERWIVIVGLIRLGNWLQIFGNFVPISMMLTLETVKFLQGNLMGMDDMLTASNGIECGVQSSNLNEELGQVEYVFSDKTGTLTCNEMRFKHLIVGNTSYGEQRGYDGEIPYVKNVDFEDPRLWQKIRSNFPSEEDKLLKECIYLLGMCHNVVLEENGDFNASSPDELAFVYFAKLVGCEFKGRDEDNNIVMEIFNVTKTYKLLDLFEFNSDRKRMAVIIQDQDKKIKMFCKGADSIMIPRYDPERRPNYDNIMEKVEEYAQIGLRTLLLGYKELSQDEYEAFKQEYETAKNNLDHREKEMDKVEDKWERGFTMIGATAIEDRLQDEVPETIETLRKAGIKVWVLTGDKVDTAKNIGYSCRLLTQTGMSLLEYSKDCQDILGETRKLLERQHDDIHKRQLKTGLLVTGSMLDIIMADESSDLFAVFSQLALMSDVVLCCRVSPKQKQEIVAMVKKAKPNVVTLAIGDGANDVNMITEAHVGIGIKGLEGQQAARASDFSIGEFKKLKRLMFYHGRESYRKNALLILYNFYKNILLCMPQFWHGFTNWLSGQAMYEPVSLQLFNLIYTSSPILLYALFERQTTDVILENCPEFYAPGLKFLWFNARRYVQWIINACIHSFAITMFGLYIFDVGGSAFDGTTYGYWNYGHTIYWAVVLLASLKILTFSYSYSILTIFMMLGSMGCFFATWIWVNTFDIGELEHSFNIMIVRPEFYLMSFFVVAMACCDFGITKIINIVWYRAYLPPTSEDDLADYLAGKTDIVVANRNTFSVDTRKFGRTYTASFYNRLTREQGDDAN